MVMGCGGAPSVLSSWARSIVEALSAKGADVQAVLEEAGMSLEDFRDPNSRHPIPTTSRLWRAASKAVGDPSFGLFASKHVHLTSFHALGYAVMASATLRDALERFVRYGRVLSDATSPSLRVEAEGARLVLERRPGEFQPADEAIDAVMSLIVRSCRLITARRVQLISVSLRRSEPADPTPYAKVFRCPIEFGAIHDEVVVARTWLDEPLPTANPVLASHNDTAARRYLASIEVGNTVDRVRATIAERMSSGAPTPDAVARALGMSVRSLQRRLHELGTTYAQLQSETRRELACAHLLNHDCTVTEVAFLVGFEDSSAFARAFRRWTGVSPSTYREREAAGKSSWGPSKAR